MKPLHFFSIVAALVLAVGGGGYWYVVGSTHHKMPPPPPVETMLPKQFLVALKQQKGGGPAIAQTKSTAPAVSAPSAQAPAAPAQAANQFTIADQGKMHVYAQNAGDKPKQFSMHIGEIYENGSGAQVVVIENCDRVIPPRGLLETDVRIAAVTLTVASPNDTCTKSSTTIPKLDLLLAQLKAQPDLSRGILQTAILGLAQNPSLDVFAKFPRLHAASAPAPGQGDFKADTADIIAALQMLNEIGVTDRALAADPQLKIEAMIDPNTHDLAMRYYGITPELEWAYWKHELLEGDPSVRHYALYGIARYYPDVALQMLPKWARETRLQPIYRLSAIRAMAVTHRAEAIPILQKLEQEFGPDTDLHQSADRASKYLSTQFNQPS